MCNIEVSKREVRKRGRDSKNWELSELPDDILLAILSLMPLKSAIVTGAFSRRWRWLWTHLPNIDISLGLDFSDKRDEFFSAVDNLLPKINTQSMNRFSLDLGYLDEDMLFMDGNRNNAHFNRWFDWVSQPDKELRELSLNIILGGHPSLFPTPPLSVFNISSLVVLHLTPWSLANNTLVSDRDNALFHLPNLKQLSVELIAHNASALENLVSSSPCSQRFRFGRPAVDS